MKTLPSTARWISHAHCPDDAAPVFQKTFDCPQAQHAELLISGLGFYTLRLNGQEVGDAILQPAFSRYDQTVYFNSVPLFLNEGENTLEVTLGNGWYHQMQADAWQFEQAIWKNTPRMIAALYMQDECVLVSDTTWQTAVSGTTFNSLRCGETFDARVIPAQWEKAVLVPAPGGVLKYQTMEPIRVRRMIEPQCVPFASERIYDFGVNLSGNAEICVEGPAGASVELQYAEQMLPNTLLSMENIDMYVQGGRFQRDEYILCGQGQECWHSHFGYNGFRYVRVRLNGGCKLLSIRARQFHTDLSDAGGIATEDESLTRILSAIRQSSLTNYHHIPTDCPHREKNGWTGDAWLSCRQMLYNFDMKNAYLKWLDDIVDCQRPSGQIPCIVPTSAWGYAWGSGITWDAALAVIPWEMYQFYGDVSILRRYAGAIIRYLDYLESMLDGGVPAAGLGDWCAPQEAPLISEEGLRCCMAVYVCRICAQMGDVLDLPPLRRKADAIADACAAALMRRKEQGQLYHAMRVLLDLDPDPQALVDAVEAADGHVMGGIFTARFVPEALTAIGCSDLAWRMATAKGYPGWDDLTLRCAGTLGEGWHGGTSMNHHMFSSIGAWYYEALAGIRALAPGFAEVRIAPYIPQNLPAFSAWHLTPHGRLSVDWQNDELTVEIPDGMAATLCLNGEEHALSAGTHRFSIA